jgi:hypothetical protein
MTQAIDLTVGGGASTATVPAATSGFVVKAKRGRLCAALVTAATSHLGKLEIALRQLKLSNRSSFF